MDGLSQISLAALWRANWTPNRRVDVSAFEAALRKAGCIPGSRALAFLQSFGGLDLVCPHPIVKSNIWNIHFDPEDALAHARSWNDYEDAIKLVLTIVGRREEDCASLLIGDDGRVFSHGLGGFALVGRTEVEALNFLCEGQQESSVCLKRVHSLRVFERAPNQLDGAVKAVLSNAGWIGERQIALASPDDHPAVRFLAEFNGLQLQVPLTGSLYDKKVYRFVAGCIDEFFARFELERLEYEMDQRFVAVGHNEERTELLLIGDSGGMYLAPKGRPEVLWCIGKSGYDAINGLVEGRGAVRV